MEGVMMDKMMVWGAWSLMAAVASLSAWKISQTPKIDPILAKLDRELHPSDPQMPAPPPVPAWRNRWVETIGEARPVNRGAQAWFVDAPPPPPPPPPGTTVCLVLPFAIPGEAKADLHGITVSWTLQDAPKENLEPWLIQTPAKPSGFIIQRQ